jgi:hypothetical protein
MGKLILSYDFMKSLCLNLADEIKEKYIPKQIIAVVRGGVSPAHIIARKLDLPMGFFVPGDCLASSKLWFSEFYGGPLVFVEDMVGKGRTLALIRESMKNLNKFNWNFVPIVVDGKIELKFPVYGIKTLQWVVFPHESEYQISEGDCTLWRERKI